MQKCTKKDSASKQAADSVHGNNEWKETRMLAKMYRLNAGVRNDNFHLELKLKVPVTEQYSVMSGLLPERGRGKRIML